MTQEQALRLVAAAVDFAIETDGTNSELVSTEMYPGDIVFVIRAVDGSRFGVTCSPLKITKANVFSVSPSLEKPK